MYIHIHINNLFLLPPDVDFLFLLTLKLHGLIFGAGGDLFARYFRILFIYQGL